MKFDVVVGNPPYQENKEDTRDSAIYNYFYDLAEQMSDRYCLISPARFLFDAGTTSKEWNKKMLTDVHLKVVWYESDIKKVFPAVGFKGGIAVMYRDKNIKVEPIVMFSAFEELNSIKNKVLKKGKFQSLSDVIYPQNKFNLTKLYEDYPKYKNIIGSNGAEKRLTTPIFTQLDIFREEKSSDEDLLILGLINNKRVWRYIPAKYIEHHPNLEKYKVIIPKSNGSGAIGEVLSTPLIGEPLIGEPLIGVTQSFISVGAFDNQLEAENALKYVKTKFARAMLGILKVTQDNPKEKWRFVPLQDFTLNSDIKWAKSIADIDKQLYKKYKLNKTEIEFIEEKVKAMDE